MAGTGTAHLREPGDALLRVEELQVEFKVGRGRTVKAVSGISLDVLPGEVTDTHLASPLLAWHDAGRIVVTPHISGATLESQTRAARIALGLLRRHVATCRS